MVARQPDVVEGSAVGAQLIGYHHLWREALFSQQLANQLDGRNACLAWYRSRPSDRWHLDEMVVRIADKRMDLWRAVDHEGEILDVLVQRTYPAPLHSLL